MTDRAPVASALLAATAQRLASAAAGVSPERPSEGPGGDLVHLVAAARRDPAVVWLALAALRGRLPVEAEVLRARRGLDLDDDEALGARLLADVLAEPWSGLPAAEMDLVVDGVVVAVDFCARHDIHTGIHRVVRETLPRWAARPSEHGPLVAVANVDAYDALRTLAPREEHRVFAFGTARTFDPAEEQAYRARLVVPWRSTLVVPEIPDQRFAPRLAALGAHSGNRLALVGYDMIPAVSADLRPAEDAVRFGHYLSAVKHAHAVAAISASATAEFAGFSHAVTAQGLPGPRVTEVVLPTDVPEAGAETGTEGGARSGPSGRTGRPRVLCVGSHEPHKNHLTVLYAAERLWREGLDFELEFIGGPGWRSEELQARLVRTARSGRPVTNRGRVSDDELWQAYRDARFSVFLSLHEGFGLPVAESLACGTPVLTSSFGSLAEIAEDGGCVTVHPADDDAVTDAMRELLTDDALVERLREAARARPRRTWDEYADEAWEVVVSHPAAATAAMLDRPEAHP